MTNNQQHTPGPWRVNDWSVKGWSIASNVGLHIASKSYVNELTGQAYRDEMLKNAHLIAAAPEMFDALEYTVALIEEYIIPTGKWEGNREGVDLVLYKARKAIKKAKGEID